MKDKIMDLLSKESFWTNVLDVLGFIGTGGAVVFVPHLAGLVGMGVIALTGPMGKGMAKIVNTATSNYAQTETKADDALHAASSAILKK